MRNLGLVFAALLVGSHGCESAVHAQERRVDAPRASAAARALFQEGVVCVDAQDWGCAADRFGRAGAVRPSPVILSNLGIALDHLGRYVEASEAFRGVLRDPTASAELRTSSQQAIERIAPRIGRLTVIATGPTEGVAFTMDGEVFDASLLGVAVPSDPGVHRLEARRAEVVATASVEVTSGGQARVELALPEPRHDVSIEAAMNATLDASATGRDSASALAADPTVTPASHDEVYEQWWFWTIVGVVVVGAGVSVTAAVVTSNETTLPAGSLGTIDVRP